MSPIPNVAASRAFLKVHSFFPDHQSLSAAGIRGGGRFGVRGRSPTHVQVIRRIEAAISSGSKTFFQSGCMSCGLPNWIALLQASENTPGFH